MSKKREAKASKRRTRAQDFEDYVVPLTVNRLSEWDIRLCVGVNAFEVLETAPWGSQWMVAVIRGDLDCMTCGVTLGLPGFMRAESPVVVAATMVAESKGKSWVTSTMCAKCAAKYDNLRPAGEALCVATINAAGGGRVRAEPVMDGPETVQ